MVAVAVAMVAAMMVVAVAVIVVYCREYIIILCGVSGGRIDSGRVGRRVGGGGGGVGSGSRGSGNSSGCGWL